LPDFSPVGKGVAIMPPLVAPLGVEDVQGHANQSWRGNGGKQGDTDGKIEAANLLYCNTGQ
jgi:hypothetical protein